MDLATGGDVVGHRALRIAGQQRRHCPQQVERLKPPLLHLHEVPLPRGGLLLLQLHRLQGRDGRCRPCLRLIGGIEGLRVFRRGVALPGKKHAGEVDQRRGEQPEHGGHSPGLLGGDHPVADDLGGHEVGPQAGAPGGLQRQAIGRAEGKPILAERIGGDRRPLERVELLNPLHVELQLFGDEIGEAAELRRISQQDHLADRGRLVGTREVVERPLELRRKLGEHRPHRLEDSPRVGRANGVSLLLLGLLEGVFHLLHQALGEAAAADRHAPLPDSQAIGHHHVGRVDADRNQHDRGRRIVGVDRVGRGQQVEHRHVGQRDGLQLEHVDFDAGVYERGEGLVDLLALHRKQRHFGVHHEAALLDSAGEPLPVPADLIEWERDLLIGLVLDDIGDLLGLDRRQLDELRQPRLARRRHRHAVALQGMPREKLLDRGPHQFHRVGVRLREHHRIFDVLKRVGHEFAGVRRRHLATKGLEAALADVDSPGVRTAGHRGLVPGAECGGCEGRERFGGNGLNPAHSPLYERSVGGVKPPACRCE